MQGSILTSISFMKHALLSLPMRVVSLGQLEVEKFQFVFTRPWHIYFIKWQHWNWIHFHLYLVGLPGIPWGFNKASSKLHVLQLERVVMSGCAVRKEFVLQFDVCSRLGLSCRQSSHPFLLEKRALRACSYHRIGFLFKSLQPLL